MKLRTVTDVERSLEEGLAPKRVAPPTDMQELLAPFDLREKAMVICMGKSLFEIEQCDESEHMIAAWKQMLTGFQTFTGVRWQTAREYWCDIIGA